MFWVVDNFLMHKHKSKGYSNGIAKTNYYKTPDHEKAAESEILLSAEDGISSEHSFDVHHENVHRHPPLTTKS